jgi:signal transduction histidine kinase
VLDLARAEEEAIQAAAREEAVRLALWRIDTAAAPLVARESARPHFVYESFYPDFRVRSLTSSELPKDGSLVATPLLSEAAPHVRLHFQLGPDGTITSPQVPTGAWEEEGAVLPSVADGDALAAWSAQLDELRALDALPWLAADLDGVADGTPLAAPARTRTEVVTTTVPDKKQGKDKPLNKKQLLAEQALTQQGMEKRAAFNEDQQARNFQEFSQRVETSTANVMVQQKTVATYLPASELATGVMQPIWVGGELVLARSVLLDGETHVQGCWLDWPALSASLVDEVADLLPEAALVPVDPTDEEDPSRRLATLPARLLPGEPAGAPEATTATVPAVLVVAWIGVLVAAAAVAALLLGVMSLSERRATFVSAVTHELRTPLTTFRMYSEMLAEGMVPEAKRDGYLRTLQVEAERLGHLVDNVLAYARLERGRSPKTAGAVGVDELLSRAVPRLEERARRSEMELRVERATAADDAEVRGEPSAIEQILLNLVDNACKYGADGDAIELSVGRDGRKLELGVRDFGAGIDRRTRRRLFRPFSRSAEEAAGSAPGVGLGLALSRRLARDLGGDLRLADADGPGACFVLTLPLA